MKEHLPSNVHITYQQQYRKCGKSTCGTCKRGPGHGLYFYGYWRDARKKQDAKKRELKQYSTVKAEVTV